MPGCAAPNCSNQSTKGFKMYRFPAELERRKKWLVNCRRLEWTPTQNDRLCSVHFEETQFEQRRADGKKILMPFAVPTLFNVSNPPKQLNFARKSVYKRSRNEIDPTNNSKKTKFNNDLPNSPLLPLTSKNCFAGSFPVSLNDNEIREENERLKNKIIDLEKELNQLKESLSTFLSEEQVSNLQVEKRFIKKWSAAAIVKNLKLRFALGKNGYNFLRETGYPAPAYSTLNKRISSITIECGLLSCIIDLLSKKVETMQDLEKDCSVMVDEMEICSDLDFDKSKQAFIGHVTLGDISKQGNHLTVVALRGISTPWKQIVACHITGPSTSGSDMKSLITEVIKAATSVGLRVRNLCSDMGSNNKAMWASLGICVNKEHRETTFRLDNNSEEINVMADGPHLLKNWKSAIQNSKIFIPMKIVEENHLPTNVVSGEHVTTLWNRDMTSKKRLRFLHHLSAEIVNPGHFSKMHVGYAMRYISVKTAAALEAAVIQKILPPAALTTAWFLRLLRQWFEIINSRKRTASITTTNFEKKKIFLKYFISIVEETIITKGWKPLNTGSILTSHSFISVAETIFQKGFKFMLGSRLTQDALENIFSQIRKRAGKKPKALAALQAIKLICLSQFMSDVKNTNYCTDTDLYLLDYSHVDEAANTETTLNVTIAATNFTAADEMNIHYIAGSCVNFVLSRKKLCESCKRYIISDEQEEQPYTQLTSCLDLGGLKKIPSDIYLMFKDLEGIIQQNMSAIINNSLSLHELMKILLNTYKHSFPQCCGILDHMLKHYATIRGLGIKSFEIDARVNKVPSYGSKSVNAKTN